MRWMGGLLYDRLCLNSSGPGCPDGLLEMGMGKGARQGVMGIILCIYFVGGEGNHVLLRGHENGLQA